MHGCIVVRHDTFLKQPWLYKNGKGIAMNLQKFLIVTGALFLLCLINYPVVTMVTTATIVFSLMTIEPIINKA